MKSKLKLPSDKYSDAEHDSMFPSDKQALRSLTGDVADIIESAEDHDPIHRTRLRHTYPEHSAHTSAYNALQRFLKAQDGRKWADVWSEVCETYPKGHPARDYIEREVDTGFIFPDGSIETQSYCGPSYTKASSLPYSNETFVDQDGILRVYKKSKNYEREPQPFSAFILDKRVFVMRHDEVYATDLESTKSYEEAQAYLKAKDGKARVGYWSSLTADMDMEGFKSFKLPNGSLHYVRWDAPKQVNTKEKARVLAAITAAKHDVSLFRVIKAERYPYL